MSYTREFVANFGPFTSLALNAKVFDSAGVQVGATITSGFVNHGDGSYSYLATLPDTHVGSLVIYDGANPLRKVRYAINPPDSAAVWSHAQRTLTSTAAETMEAITGDNLNITKAATFTAQLTGLNIPSSWTKIYFTTKSSNQYADSQALVQILKSNPSAGGDGLIRLNSAPSTVADGSLTIDQPGGSVTITLTDEATLQLNHGDYFYDIKALSSDSSSVVLAQGNCLVRLTSTHTV